jgi:uncharacterized protein
MYYVSSRRRSGNEQEITDVSLFSTKKNVISVQSPIKIKILEMITDGVTSFDEIVSRTQKAKSTISVHLRDLEEAGLIRSSPDPKDSRKRYITLASDAIGRLTNTDRHIHPKQIVRGEENLPFNPNDITSFFRYVVLTFRTESMLLGINIDPVLYRTGEKTGKVLSRLVLDPDIHEMVRKISQFWSAHQLGKLSLVSTEPITIRVTGCFECEDLPETGHGACAFDTGVLTALFSLQLKRVVTVVEEECYSSG